MSPETIYERWMRVNSSKTADLQTTPLAFEGIHESSAMVAYSSAAAGGQDCSSLSRHLRTAVEGWVALFDAATTVNPRFDAHFADIGTVSLERTGITSLNNAGCWSYGVWAATAIRADESVRHLASVPAEVFREASPSDPEYHYLYAESIRAFVLKAPTAPRLIFETLKATDPDDLPEYTVDYALLIVVPALELMTRLWDNDKPAFDKAMIKALENHRRYWSHPDRSKDLSGSLAIPPLALARLADDKGWVLDVQSDYIPECLYRKSAP